jgi:hypothetical protein
VSTDSQVQDSRPASTCIPCGGPITFERGLIFGVCEPCWDAALATSPLPTAAAPAAGTVTCSCGWSGPHWTAAKDHVVEAMRENAATGIPRLHEVTKAEEA